MQQDLESGIPPTPRFSAGPQSSIPGIPPDSGPWTGMPSHGKIPDPEFHRTPEL